MINTFQLFGVWNWSPPVIFSLSEQERGEEKDALAFGSHSGLLSTSSLSIWYALQSIQQACIKC